jgi:ACT domain-containing protein
MAKGYLVSPEQKKAYVLKVRELVKTGVPSKDAITQTGISKESYYRWSQAVPKRAWAKTKDVVLPVAESAPVTLGAVTLIRCQTYQVPAVLQALEAQS